jgi:hypothetical protein
VPRGIGTARCNPQAYLLMGSVGVVEGGSGGGTGGAWSGSCCSRACRYWYGNWWAPLLHVVSGEFYPDWEAVYRDKHRECAPI